MALRGAIMWRSQEITFWINSLSPWFLPFYKGRSYLDFSLLCRQIHKNGSILSPAVLQPESDKSGKYHLWHLLPLGGDRRWRSYWVTSQTLRLSLQRHLLYFVFPQPSTFTLVHGSNALFILRVWVFFTSFRKKTALSFWVTLWLGLVECFLFCFALRVWVFF